MYKHKHNKLNKKAVKQYILYLSILFGTEILLHSNVNLKKFKDLSKSQNIIIFNQISR